MNSDEQTRLIEQLHRRRSDLLTNRSELTVSTRPVELDQTTQGRLSRIDAIQQQHMAKASQAHMSQEIARIDAALARHAKGVFGRCCRCEFELEPERLRADPAVPFCLDCLAEIQNEKRRQQHLDRNA